MSVFILAPQTDEVLSEGNINKHCGASVAIHRTQSHNRREDLLQNLALNVQGDYIQMSL